MLVSCECTTGRSLNITPLRTTRPPPSPLPLMAPRTLPRPQAHPDAAQPRSTRAPEDRRKATALCLPSPNQVPVHHAGVDMPHANYPYLAPRARRAAGPCAQSTRSDCDQRNPFTCVPIIMLSRRRCCTRYRYQDPARPAGEMRCSSRPSQQGTHRPREQLQEAPPQARRTTKGATSSAKNHERRDLWRPPSATSAPLGLARVEYAVVYALCKAAACTGTAHHVFRRPTHVDTRVQKRAKPREKREQQEKACGKSNPQRLPDSGRQASGFAQALPSTRDLCSTKGVRGLLARARRGTPQGCGPAENRA